MLFAARRPLAFRSSPFAFRQSECREWFDSWPDSASSR